MAQETPVDKMFKVMSMDKQFSGGFESMLPMIDQMSVQFKLNNEDKKELKDIFRAWFDEDIDHSKIMQEMKKLYSQSFTDKEIIQITTFYQTPIGKKFLEKTPLLMKVGMQIGMKEGQSKQAQLMARIKPFLEKHSIK
ncbi:MAG: DUF2059 domain-containing protein [Alteromonadales bacterium]|nr:DUF2059 domain-containing protein [Alteromonadales bacterium]